MIKLKYSLFLALLVVASCKPKIINDLTEKAIKGNVSYYSEDEYSINIVKGKAEKRELLKSYRFSYNENGNEWHNEYLKYSGDHTFTSATSTEYANGKKHVSYVKINGEKTPTYTTKYTCDEFGDVIEANVFAGVELFGKSSNKYDKDRNKIESLFTTNGKIDKKTIFEYDNKRRLVVEKDFYVVNSESIEETRKYKYDAIGNESVIEIFNKGGESNEKFIYQDFDEINNWRYRITLVNDKGERITKRTFIYY